MKSKNNISLLSFSSAWFFVYIFFCIIYFKERILNLDNSSFFYELINDSKFSCPGYRYSNFFTQIPLRLATFASLSVKSFLYIFSLSFPLFYLLCFLLILLKFKQTKVAMILLSSLIIGSGYSFYHPVGETFLSIVFASILIAVLRYVLSFQKFSIQNYIWIGAILICSFFSHPSAVILIFFVLGYFYFDEPSSRKKNRLLFSVFIFSVLLILLKLLVFTNPGNYDSNLYSQILNAPELLSKLFTLYPFDYLILKFYKIYYAPMVMLVLAIIYFIWLKNFKLFFFSIIYFIFSFILTFIIYNKGDSDVMMERSFLPLVFICCMLFCLIKTDNIIWKNSLFILLILFSSFSFYRIFISGLEYSKRLNILNSVISYQRKTNQPKLISTWNQLPREAKFFYWDTPFDVLFLSSIDGGEQTTLYCCENISEIDMKNNNSHLFLGFPWRLYLNDKIFTKKYITIKSVPYSVLTKSLIP